MVGLFGISVVNAQPPSDPYYPSVGFSSYYIGGPDYSTSPVTCSSSRYGCTFTAPNNAPHLLEVVPADVASLKWDTILEYWNGSAWVTLADDNGPNQTHPTGGGPNSSTYYRVRAYTLGTSGKFSVLCTFAY